MQENSKLGFLYFFTNDIDFSLEICHNKNNRKELCGEDMLDSDNANTRNDVTEEIIFSKPANEPKVPEVIHAFEYKEVKSLYGEKVVIQEKGEAVKEIVLEPLDKENGLTPEEIELAKAETLKKASDFEHDVLDEKTNIPAEETSAEAHIEKKLNDNSSPSISKEERILPLNSQKKPLIDDEEPEHREIIAECKKKTEAEEEKRPVFPQKEYKGLFPMLLEKGGLDNQNRTLFTILLSVIASPLLFLCLTLLSGIFLGAVCAVLVVAVFALLLLIFLISAGVIEILYGIFCFFDSVAVALIELGLGTVLFGLVTAIGALIRDLLTRFFPKLIRYLVRLYVAVLKKVRCMIYGGVA